MQYDSHLRRGLTISQRSRSWALLLLAGPVGQNKSQSNELQHENMLRTHQRNTRALETSRYLTSLQFADDLWRHIHSVKPFLKMVLQHRIAVLASGGVCTWRETRPGSRSSGDPECPSWSPRRSCGRPDPTQEECSPPHAHCSSSQTLRHTHIYIKKIIFWLNCWIKIFFAVTICNIIYFGNFKHYFGF